MVTTENTQMVPTENICVADEEKILCIVRDMLDTECHGIRHSINLPASTMVKDMISQVAKQFGYIDDTIDITYEKQTGAEIHEVSLGKLEYEKLQDVCLSGIKKHNFTITEKQETLPQKVQRAISSETRTSSSGISSSPGSSSYLNGASTSTSTSAATNTCFTNQESYSYATAVIKSDTGYVGLVNQAMTCYLNSLIQTLYMTPEFRNAVYRWEFDGKEDNMTISIPYQLQKLFLLLQTSKKKAIETTDLTRSFGWDSSEVWQQHDVQELCRVMFDALEQKWKKTDQANLINNLYQGKLKDYVKCLECGNESARLDTYLDIPLVIRPFGSNESHGSVLTVHQSVKLLDRNKKDEILTAQKLKKVAREKLPFYITPQQPTSLNSARNKLFDKVDSLRKQNINVKVQRNRLVMPNGSIFKEEVSPISSADSLQITSEESQSLDEVIVVLTDPVQRDSSEFTAIGAKIKSAKDTENVYKKVSIDPYAASCDSRIFVYRFQDQSGKIHEDYHDDREHGAGRRLLRYCQDNQIMSVAVCVTRWIGDSHIGPVRFSITENLVCDVINKLDGPEGDNEESD